MVLKLCFNLTRVKDNIPLKTVDNAEKRKQNPNYTTETAETPTGWNDYNPYDYGNENQPTVFWGPVLHLLKTIIGTGILTLPYTFQIVGYLTGIVGTLLIALLYTHIIRVLLDVEYQLCKELKVPNLTYVEVVRHSFKNGPKSVCKLTNMAAFLVYFQYVVNGSFGNCAYLIMIGDNFKMIIDHYFSIESNITVILSVIVVALLMMGCIRNLKFLAPLSAITNVFNFVNILLILIISPNYSKLEDLQAFNDFTQFPVFFGIVLSALTGTGMILPLKNDMKRPADFSSSYGVLNIVFALTTVLYMFFGFFGYMKFGNHIQASILTNLPADHFLSILVLVLYSLSICVSYILFVFIAFDTIWSNLFKMEISNIKYPLITEYTIRICLVLIPYLIAIVIPNFEIMISIGGIIGILVDIAVPPILHVLLLWEKGTCRFRNFIILKDLIIIAIALFLFFSGAFDVFQKILQFHSH